ncbi:hypothetical protein [Cerasicoccus fimbriatus]|uniref:hypothetical protein n=1 Tax=Cerasicoccus fimbriatus TaxID=3014554 RepID=UPI0022B3044C|nr:hypothetical protein [Cerasicoccus sp. TK19100]
MSLAPALQAAKKNDEPAAVTDIPDETLVRYLSSEELRQWRELERAISQAKADIETGNWLAEKKDSPFVEKSRTEADRKRGKDMVKDGEARLAELEKQLNVMRAAAAASVEKYQAQFESQSVSLEVKALPLMKAIEDPTEALLYKLWNDNYTKIYFGGAYVLKNGAYAKAVDLSDQVKSTIARYDGNRYTFVEDVSDFTLGVENGKPVINFEGREDAVKRFKPAMVIIEVIFDPEAEHGIYALRGIDLKTGKPASQTLLRFPVGPNTAEQLGYKMEEILTPVESAPTAEAQTEAPAAEAAEATEKPAVAKQSDVEPTGLTLTLVDNTNVLGRLGNAKASYVFDVMYVGQIDGYDERAAIVLNNALMRAQDLKIDDFEFLTLALAPTDEAVTLESSANATWKVSPTSPVDFAIGDYGVQAIANNNGQEVAVEIGSLTIEPGTSGKIPPQAAKN